MDEIYQAIRRKTDVANCKAPARSEHLVGFWRDAEDFTHTFTDFPVEHSATHTQAKAIQLLEAREDYCRRRPETHVTDYYGCSFCRICNKPNGASEYRMDGFVWPSGYLHYLKDHQVQMDPSFHAYLLSEIMH
jgi:hypothetical protein